MKKDPKNPNLIWILFSKGNLFCYDKNGKEITRIFLGQETTCFDLGFEKLISGDS
jgi:hypothetical protein